MWLRLLFLALLLPGSAWAVSAREGATYVPPPRTINDIITKFGGDREIPPNCNAVRARQEALQGKLHQAAEQGRDPAILVASFERAAQQEFVRGDLSSSQSKIKMLQKEVSRYERAWVVAQALLAKYEALGGDFKAADAAMQKGRRNRCKDRWGSGVDCSTGDEGVWVNIHQAVAEAAIAQSKGLYEDAEVKLRQAAEWELKEAWKFRAAYDISVHLSLLAENLMLQGRYVEAELEARKALQLFVDDDAQLASLFLAMAEVLYEQGRYTEAEYLGRRAVNLSEANCLLPESVILALARRLVARTLVGQSRWEEAIEQYEAVRRALSSKEPGLFERKFAGDVEWGLALLKKGRVNEAAKPIRLAYERSRTRLGEDHPQTARALGFLAVAHAEQGERQQALDAFRVAIPTLLSAWRERSNERSFVTTRSQQLRLILEAYIQLLDDIRGTPLENRAGVDPIEEMFRIADVARSGAVQQALAANSARAAAGSPALARLVRRQQDAQNQIGALQNVLLTSLSQSARDQKPAVISDLRARIKALRASQKNLISEIEKQFPRYAELISPKPLTVADVQRRLRAGETLVSILVTESRTYVWAIPWQGSVVFAAIDIGREELTEKVGLLRIALDPRVTTLDDIPNFDLVEAYQLYERLFKPVEEGWKPAKSLLVVADVPLGQLPPSLLPTEPAELGRKKALMFANYRTVPWLARTHAVTMLPSVSSLRTFRKTPAVVAGERRPFVGFGDPYFSLSQARSAEIAAPVQVASAEGSTRAMAIRMRNRPQTRKVNSADLALLPRLPDTRAEINAIGRALGADPDRDIFLGRRATEGRVKSMDLSGYNVIAFATHGLVPGDLNGLTQPALALSAPQVSGEEGLDGLLTMGEILGLKLNADWAVLSACNTAAAEGKGAEAVSGLGRAFFYAGARALLVSHWPVFSAATTELTTDLFRRRAANKNVSKAEALRQTRVHLIDEAGFKDQNGRMVFSYAHPIFWAPFSIVGDGG